LSGFFIVVLVLPIDPASALTSQHLYDVVNSPYTVLDLEKVRTVFVGYFASKTPLNSPKLQS